MPGLDGLHIVAHAGHENHDRDISQAHDIDFVLPNADGLDQDDIASGSIEHGSDISRCACQSAQRSARRHAANVNSRIGEVILHTDAVAQNRAARVRAGGIDRDDADGTILFAIVPRQLIDQRALSGARRASEPNDAGLPLCGKMAFKR